MSTRIYDAYRLPPEVQVGNVMQWAIGHREKINDLLANEWERATCTSACEKLDRMILGAAGLATPIEEETGGVRVGLLGEAGYRLEESYIKRNKAGERMPMLDTQVKLIVFPHEDRCLAKLICDSRPVMDYFNALEGVEDFSYWNNSDEPEHISQEDWDERGNIWDALLPSGKFELDGMVVNIRLEGDVPRRDIDHDKIARHLPSLDRRAGFATHSTPVSAEIFNREGRQMSLVVQMDQGKFEEFNTMRDRVRSLLPEAEVAAALITLPVEQRQAAIAEIAMKFNTQTTTAAQAASPRI